MAMLWISGVPSVEAVEIVVDVRKALSNVERKPGGFVTSWLFDSDKERPKPTSMMDVYKRLGVESVRFPFGHLANNYLWTSPPYDHAKDGLTPRVASMSVSPAKWEWAVNPDGTFIKDLDFDEFIGQCREVGIEPVIVINVMSHKYRNGPSLDALKEAAVEWVRYANVTRDYGVKYWQLGNEQEHHPKLMTLTEYRQIYGDFSAAMKAVDPTIRTGVAVINNRQWATALLEAFPKNVDFVACHQYQWHNWTVQGWVDFKDPVIPNALVMASIIRNSPRPDAEIMVTETSSQGSWADGSGKPDIMRALCFAEMLLHYSTIENLAYTHLWCTHNAWPSKDPDGEIAGALTLENGLKPNAVVLGLVNRSLGDRMVQANRVAGPLRAFASHMGKDGKLVVYLINKSDKPVVADIRLNGMAPQKVQSRLVYSGAGYDDLNPKITNDVKATISGGTVTTLVPGISLTILTLN